MGVAEMEHHKKIAKIRTAVAGENWTDGTFADKRFNGQDGHEEELEGGPRGQMNNNSLI